MSFQIGDKVKIRADRKHRLVSSAISAVEALDTDGVFTIDKIIHSDKGIQYNAKEFDFKWKWNDIDLELIKLSEHNFDPSEKINSRFEILDL